MNLKTQDTYSVDGQIQQVDLRSLLLLYQPILGKKAILFYMTCLSETTNLLTQEPHKRLSILLNMSMDELEEARKLCEEFLLMKTFVREQGELNQYFYQCKPPLVPTDFFKNDLYSRLLLKAVGQTQYQCTLSMFMKKKEERKDAMEITKALDRRRLISWNQANETEFSKIKPTYQFHEKGPTEDFNYAALFQSVTPLIFPLESRTEENLKVIGELAILYGIPVERMRILIGRCINLSDNQLDIQRLKKIAALEKPKIEHKEDPWTMSPTAFLQAKQRGIEVTSSDKKLLAYLSLDLKMKPEVINVLVDYVLRINDNRLTKNYVQAIAAQWIRSEVKTKEMAIEMTKKSTNMYKPARSKAKLPEYFEQVREKVKKEEVISQKEEQEILKKLRELGE